MFAAGFDSGEACGVAETWALALAAVLGVDVGFFTAEFALVKGTGQRRIPLGCITQLPVSAGMNGLPVLGSIVTV